ncbi:hypothetical protein [Acinetobacter sp. ABJ_C5_2]|uniref:hypothetical protein n=1 Tax=Acinetobacter sp. ABJ_C5_2 TaxID=3376992 RepID=UPI0037C9BFA0
MLKQFRKKIPLFLPLLFFTQHVFASECNEEKVTPLSIFNKHDYEIHSYICDSEDGKYIKNYLSLSNKTNFIFLNKIENDGSRDNPKQLAVSIYHPRGNKKPLLITLHGQYDCCYPHPEGTTYYIDIFKINENGKVYNISNILGRNVSGYDGQNDIKEKSFFNLKDIASIKKWLEKNYK